MLNKNKVPLIGGISDGEVIAYEDHFEGYYRSHRIARPRRCGSVGEDYMDVAAESKVHLEESEYRLVLLKGEDGDTIGIFVEQSLTGGEALWRMAENYKRHG